MVPKLLEKKRMMMMSCLAIVQVFNSTQAMINWPNKELYSVQKIQYDIHMISYNHSKIKNFFSLWFIFARSVMHCKKNYNTIVSWGESTIIWRKICELIIVIVIVSLWLFSVHSIFVNKFLLWFRFSRLPFFPNDYRIASW